MQRPVASGHLDAPSQLATAPSHNPGPRLSSHPAHRQMSLCICSSASSPFFLSLSKALRFSFCLTHPFMLQFPPSGTRSLCPQADPDCLSQHSTGSQSPSLRQTYSHKPVEPIHMALIFIKVNPSLKKIWLMMKVFTLQITFNNPRVVSLVINANPPISPTTK